MSRAPLQPGRLLPRRLLGTANDAFRAGRMTILIVLVGLIISHFATGFRHFRKFGWLAPLLIAVSRRFPQWPWLPAVFVVVFSVLASVLAIWLVTALLGLAGWFLLALAVFILTLGPRDLDRDVAVLLSPDPDDPAAVEDARRAMQLDEAAGPCEGVAAVLHAGLSRWFGLLFWFVLLGIAGALIYRLTRVGLQSASLDPAAIEWLARLRLVLDWPVLALLSLSLALAGDLDRVLAAWRAQAAPLPTWLLVPSQIDRLAEAICGELPDLEAGLELGHQMVWRMLILWLVVLSMLLLAGWLS